MNQHESKLNVQMKSCHGAAVKSGAAWPGFKNWNLLKKSQEQHVTLSMDEMQGLCQASGTHFSLAGMPLLVLRMKT